MTRFIIILILIQFANLSFGQSKKDYDYLIKEGQDTIYCMITEISRESNNIDTLIYYDLDKKKNILNKDQMKKILTIGVDGRILDYIPIKASKPLSYHRHVERKIDGPIKVYDYIQLCITSDDKANRHAQSLDVEGSMIYTILLDDEKYYKIKASNIKKIFLPYMKECEAFKVRLKEPVDMSNFEETVKLYNSVCRKRKK